MKLKLLAGDSSAGSEQDAASHGDIVGCLCWTHASTSTSSYALSGGNSGPELWSFGSTVNVNGTSEDGQLGKWSQEGKHLTFGPLPTASATTASGQALNKGGSSPGTVFALDVAWLSSSSSSSSSSGLKGSLNAGGAASSVLVIGGSDGKCYVCGKNGRLEKVFEAHKGGVTVVRWNHDGSSLLTAGEDGQVKIWSRSMMLRSVLAQNALPIYSACWSPDSDHVLYTNGSNLVLKPLQPSQKPMQWKAHEGSVLKVDWNASFDLIVSTGEDNRYKIWDTYGRAVFTSAPESQPFTSVAWNPQGDLFAVGSFNTIRICDKTGWSDAIAKPDTGSIFDIKWSADGTQLAFAGGNGRVQVANIVDRHLRWKHLEVTLEDEHKVLVKNLAQVHNDHFEVNDRVSRASIGFGYLLLATASQLYVYSVKNFNTPSMMELSPTSRLLSLHQTHGYFLMVDSDHGLRVFTYDCKLVSSPKLPSLRLDAINESTLSLSPDTIAIRDKTDEKAVYLLETTTGRPIGEQPAIRHSLEIVRIGLDQNKAAGVRQLALVDKNRDLYLMNASGSTSTSRSNVGTGRSSGHTPSHKLASVVESVAWNEDNQLLAAIVDGQMSVWYYPSVVFVDPDLKEKTRAKGLMGAGSTGHSGSTFRQGSISGFYGVQCWVRRSDGAMVSVSGISPYPVVLMEVVRKKQWEDAVKLCRFLKSEEIWACLAAMSVHSNELGTAEVAYASIDEVDKVQHICFIKELESAEARQAELALFRRNPREAENILLTSGQYQRCIQMWLDLFQWDRALELATKFQAGLDVTLSARNRYLEAMQWSESNPKFLQAAQLVGQARTNLVQ